LGNFQQRESQTYPDTRLLITGEPEFIICATLQAFGVKSLAHSFMAWPPEITDVLFAGDIRI
jgi:hypothetical protein